MKRMFVLLLIGLFVFLVGCSGQVKKPVFSEDEFSVSGPGVLKVMTYNIRVDTFLDFTNRWSRRKGSVLALLTSNGADVIGLQEGLSHQVGDIAWELGGYSHYAVGRNDGLCEGESCAIFYRSDRFSCAESGTFWFSDTPTVAGSKDWGNCWPRICSWVRLIDKESGSGFYVYNVHMAVLSQRSREKSVRLLARKISERKTKEPFFVMGDFNMEIDNSAMVYLQNENESSPYVRMFDAWMSVYGTVKNGGTRPGVGGFTVGPKIDHIPVSEGIVPLEVRVDRRKIGGRKASDHWPVIAKVELESLGGTSPVAKKTDGDYQVFN